MVANFFLANDDLPQYENDETFFLLLYLRPKSGLCG